MTVTPRAQCYETRKALQAKTSQTYGSTLVNVGRTAQDRIFLFIIVSYIFMLGRTREVIIISYMKSRCRNGFL